MLKLFSSGPDDLSGFLAGSQTNLTEIADRYDDIYWLIEKEGINLSIATEIEQETNLLQTELTSIFSIEEDIIYRELEKVLPDQSSVSAIKSDNENILVMCDSISALVSKIDDLKKEKDLLQAMIIAIIDLIRRNVNKKAGILYHEVQTMLPEETISEIMQKVKNIYQLNE